MFIDFFRSFKYAARGLHNVFQRERNFRVQVYIALIIFVFMFVFPFSRIERLILLTVIMAVLVLELLNSSIEYLVDLVKPRLHEYARDVKDAMSGAVLLASIFAIVIGLIIFWPHIFDAKFIP